MFTSPVATTTILFITSHLVCRCNNNFVILTIFGDRDYMILVLALQHHHIKT